MINSDLFTVEELLEALLDNTPQNGWMKLVEILPDYRFPFASDDASKLCAVRCGEHYLCFSNGPVQHYYWSDIGNDFKTPENALIALLKAPVPPCFRVPCG